MKIIIGIFCVVLALPVFANPEAVDETANKPVLTKEEAEQMAIENHELFKFQYPLLVCAHKDFVECNGYKTLDECVNSLKSYRESCNERNKSGDVKKMHENFVQYNMCMMLKHAGLNSAEEVGKDHCLNKVVLDLEGAKETIKKMDPKKVKELLE